MIIMVTGGRQYTNRAAVEEALAPYAKPGNMLVHGGASGADTLAKNVWAAYQLPYLTMPAPWDIFGKGAGPIRNTWMVNGEWFMHPEQGVVGYRPDMLIAFPGGKGTADARVKAEGAGIQVVRVDR